MSVWTERDLPVLRALANPHDDVRAGFLSIGSGDDLGIGMAPLDLIDSVLTLRDAGYITFRDQQETFGEPNLHLTGVAVTGAGMQILGEWPLFDAVASPEMLADLLERLAPEASTPEETAAARSGRNLRRWRSALCILSPWWARSCWYLRPRRHRTASISTTGRTDERTRGLHQM